MSQIAPDIPELQHLPEVVRPFIYTRALTRASMSPSTLVLGLVGLCILTGGGFAAGSGALGTSGGVVGGLAGTALAFYFFFRALIPWQTRRSISIAEREIDWKTKYRDIIDARDRFSRVADAYKAHHMGPDRRRQP